MAIFVLVLQCFAPIRGGEKKSDADHTEPIPISKIKRSTPVDFEGEILPILKNNCLACHNQTTAKAKLILETPEALLKGGESGPAVVPKHGSASLLFRVASHQIEDTIMPPPGNKVRASDLTPQELGLIKLWIDQGARPSIRTRRPIQWQPLPEGLAPIYAVAVTPDGQFAACSRANQIFIYHLPSSRLVGRLTDPQLLKSGLYNKRGAAHRSIVHSLAFSPDGELLASGGYREVKIWSRPKQTQKFKLASAARKEVLAVAISPDGTWLATGGDDGRIKIWSLVNGKPTKNLTGHKGAIRSLRFSNDNTRLASVSADKTIRIWDVSGGKPVAQVRHDSEIKAVAWLANHDQIASGGADKLIHIWRLDEGHPELTPVKELKGHESPVTALATVPSPNPGIISAYEDGSLCLWNTETGQLIREMKHGGPVTAVAVRGDGRRFASAGMDKVAKLWDASDGKEIAVLKGDREAQEFAADRQRALVFVKSEVEFYKTTLKSAETNQLAQAERVKKADDASLTAEKALAERQNKLMEATEAKAGAEKTIEEAKAEAKKALEELEAADKAAKQAESKAVKEAPGQDKETIERAVAEAAAKSNAAAAAKKDADKISADAKQKEAQATERLKSATKTLEETQKELKKAEQTRSNAETELQLAGKAVAAAAEAVTKDEESVRQTEELEKETEMEVDSAKEAAADSERPLRTIAFSPDNVTLATAGEDGLIHFWGAENGPAFETISGNKGPVFAVAFTSDGNLVSGAAERSAVVWDLKAEWKLNRVIGAGDADSSLVDHVNAVKFSPNGRTLATGGGEPTRGGEIKIWHVATGNLMQSFANVHSDAVFSLDFSPDGKYLASGAADKFVKVVELATGKVVRQFEGHTHHVLGVSWNRNERTLASAGADNVVKLWDFVTGEKKKNIAGFDKEVTAISFVGYTDQALAASGDSKVRLVREDGNDVRSFSGANDFLESAAVTPDGKIVVAGGQDSVLRVWDGTDGKLITTFLPPDARR